MLYIGIYSKVVTGQYAIFRFAKSPVKFAYDNILTACNEVGVRTIFSIACEFKNSVHRGCLPHFMLGYPSPGADTPWPDTPMGPDTPPEPNTPPGPGIPMIALIFTDFYQLITLLSTWLCTFYNGVSMRQKSVNISSILIQSIECLNVVRMSIFN